MNKQEILCPDPLDLEPTCFTFNSENVLNHARTIVKRAGLKDGIKPAIGLIIPSSGDDKRILYGLRSPLSSDFPNAWGLPSTSIPIELLTSLVTNEGEMNHACVLETINILTNRKQKLPDVILQPEKIIGWTGRIRLKMNGFDGDYYLVMVDIRTASVDPQHISASSVAYSEFRWLTPEEHKKLVEETPSRACGACSALAYQAFQKEHGNYEQLTTRDYLDR